MSHRKSKVHTIQGQFYSKCYKNDQGPKKRITTERVEQYKIYKVKIEGEICKIECEKNKEEREREKGCVK